MECLRSAWQENRIYIILNHLPYVFHYSLLLVVFQDLLNFPACFVIDWIT